LNYVAPSGGVDGDSPAFVLTDVSLPTTIYPANSDQNPKGLIVQVVFTKPDDELARSATLAFESNSTDGTQTIQLTTEAGQPSLQVSPSTLDFGLVPQGIAGIEEVTLLNVGSKPLTIHRLQIKGDPRFGAEGDGFKVGGGPLEAQVHELLEPIVIQPGSTDVLHATFITESPTPGDGQLVIYSDDPSSGVAGKEVPMTANKNGPCVQITPREVQFGAKLVGTLASVDVDIESCGTEPLTVTQIHMQPDSSPDFGYDLSGLPAGAPSSADPLVLPVNEKVTITVTYVPSEISPLNADGVAITSQGWVLVESNAFESSAAIELYGAGADKECPTAVIYVEEGSEVIPQTVLHLDGTQSYAPFGQITNYDWDVIQPDGSVSTLVPGPTDPTPVFEANVVGIYTFRLRVRDETANWSCDPEWTTYDVLVQPDQAIHVELTWATPGDADETDTGEGVGTDLDLHFAHPSASGPDLDLDGVPDPWFDPDWDCFWWNQSPNWGSFDPDANDNPGLDRDDTDGGGPENLNLAIPEEDTSYRIGVHFWNDHSFGDVLATVRVFSYADEIYAAEDMPLTSRDLWCVGTITWPEPVVTPCADAGLAEITPDYVNPFFLSQ